MRLPNNQIILTICAYFCTYRNVTDGQTDGQKWYINIAFCVLARAEAR